MRKKSFLFLLLVVVAAFWQIFFLQNGMKWDFVDAFLPSRYFFSESVLNNQFPLWNPYLLYGTPIFADLVSVFSPEYWVVANLFGYSNISLQFVFLLYVFLAGVSFNYFLKLFKVESKFSLALSVAYMLSGLTVGNAQHISFVYGFAFVPFVSASYFLFIRNLNKESFLQLSLALFLMIFGAYPGFTIILGYFLLAFFLFAVISNFSDKKYVKKIFARHLLLALVVLFFSSVLLVAYFQGAPFLERYGGLSVRLAERHAFTFHSFLSFILPMMTGADASFFGTDASMSNAYFGIISLVLLFVSLTKKPKEKEASLILGFGIFALLASLGRQFFLREFLYHYFPLMNMFQYPSIFRGFAIFGFLAFTGINLKTFNFEIREKKTLKIVSGVFILLILVLIAFAIRKSEHFVFFQRGKTFVEELDSAGKFDVIILQGSIQVLVLFAFLFSVWKIKNVQKLSSVLLFLFLFDGVVSVQLNAHYTVISQVNPIKFYEYLKASPKGFPVPEMNPIGENSDKNAENEFVWMNNNVFPKKVTFDGQISFQLDGYAQLQDEYPDLLEAIKQEPLIYFSDDARVSTSIDRFSLKTVFLSKNDFKKIEGKHLERSQNDNLKITLFSPKKIEIDATTQFSQLLVFQQNFFKGWQVFVDGKQQDLLTSNFAHMAVLAPPGKHDVVFEFRNPLIKYVFGLSYFVFFTLLFSFVFFYVKRHPGTKKRVFVWVTFSVLFFCLGSFVNRYLYQKNKQGLASTIIKKTNKWKEKYGEDIHIFLSTSDAELKSQVPVDAAFFVDANTNIPAFSELLINSKSKYFGFAWQGESVDSNLKELLFSFYPHIILQKTTSNSGIIFLDKNAEVSYDFQETFEEQNAGSWTADTSRIKIDSFSGNHSYRFGAENEWGNSVEIQVDKKLESVKQIVILSDLLFEKKPDETLLVFSTERDGEIQIYKTLKINTFVSESGKWGRIAFSVPVESKLKKGDRIKIYFWNIKKVPFQIDNLKVKYVD